MNARSALFDLYGDHLIARGGAAPVASLVKILSALKIAAPAVRTAVSRMVRQQWLEPVRLDSGAGYRLTARAERRLTEAAARIYRSGIGPWDGRWHVLVVDHVDDRTARTRVRNGLEYLGYAPLCDGTWIGPRASGELDTLLDGEGVNAQRFWARHDGDDKLLTAAAWDLDGLSLAYRSWLTDAQALAAALPAKPSDADAFVVRSHLVHEWRKFLFRDPGLPAVVLPADWAGHTAAKYFDRETGRLHDAAERYVDACLRPNGDTG